MGVNSTDRDNVERRAELWQRHCSKPGGRSTYAMRLLLGLTPYQAASRAGVPYHMLTAFETGRGDLQDWHVVSHRLDAAYRAMGARWCEPSLHDGACCVYLETGFADDRRAILAALALMGRTTGKRPRKVTVQMLAERVEARSKIAAGDLRKALRGRVGLSAKMAAACFYQLGEGRDGAGCYFVAAPLSGWRQVGCDGAGCWW